MVADPAIAAIRAIAGMSLHEELIVVADILAERDLMQHRMAAGLVRVAMVAVILVVIAEGTVS